jgi:hypothetical protein
MIIEKNTIIFKSTPSSWEKERIGSKPNVVRHLANREIATLNIELDKNGNIYSHKNKMTRIKLINSFTGEQFTRNITDVTMMQIGNIYVFSWNPNVNHVPKINDKDAYNLLKAGLTEIEMATELNVCPKTVHNWKKQHGLTRRKSQS